MLSSSYVGRTKEGSAIPSKCKKITFFGRKRQKELAPQLQIELNERTGVHPICQSVQWFHCETVYSI
jgi:hypothetical protein